MTKKRDFEVAEQEGRTKVVSFVRSHNYSTLRAILHEHCVCCRRAIAATAYLSALGMRTYQSESLSSDAVDGKFEEPKTAIVHACSRWWQEWLVREFFSSPFASSFTPPLFPRSLPYHICFFRATNDLKTALSASSTLWSTVCSLRLCGVTLTIFFPVQAALGGGGGGVQTTQTGLQTISGYNPPDNTSPPAPENYSSGSILVPSQIPGYTGKENSQGVTSGTIRLDVGRTLVGAMIGAAVFAFL